MEEKKLSRRHFLQCGLAACASSGLLNLMRGTGLAQEREPAPDKVTKITPMDEGQPSKTAMGAAVLRAVHQILDDPKVFDDPIALRIIGTESESRLRANLDWFKRRRFMRAFIVMRSRYAEDELGRAVQKGIRQYVILGAGLDTFPYRNPYVEPRLRVYEVDHPATQSWKRKRLLEAGIPIPDSLTFAPIDFEKQTLAEGLRQAGFKSGEPAFFSLLGVVIYLTKAAVMETFKFVASLPKGSEIVFDYGVPGSSLDEFRKFAREFLESRMAAIGEPWLTYFDPDSLAGDLRKMGFNYVEDFGAEAANERYFKSRQDGLQVDSSVHLMKARV